MFTAHTSEEGNFVGCTVTITVTVVALAFFFKLVLCPSASKRWLPTDSKPETLKVNKLQIN
jgi:hypothetical protein